MAASSFHSLHRLPPFKLRGVGTKRLLCAKAEQSSASLVAEKQKDAGGDQGMIRIGSKTVAFIVERLRESALAPNGGRGVGIGWPLQAEIAIDQAIINCRFFTLVGIVGSLVGSILCFVEGCCLMLEAYLEDLHVTSQRLDGGKTVHVVIEAIDMFLVGTAMLTFGMGLYSMFVGLKRTTQRSGGLLIRESNVFGLFHPKKLSAASSLNSISHAKTRLGHAVVMLLQVGVVEKFKNVPMVTGLDLACFAGALIVLSASMFLLSLLHCCPKSKVANERNSHDETSQPTASPHALRDKMN